MIKTKLYIIATLFFLFLSEIKPQCGEYRWDIKTLSDADTVNINFDDILTSSIPEQLKFQRPEMLRSNSERMDDETSVYELDCYLISYKRDKDFDITMVLKDINSNATIMASIPSPWCPEVKETSRYPIFEKLHKWFYENIGMPTERYKSIKAIPVLISGVIIFDRIQAEKGASNGRIMHPVLKMIKK